MGNIIFYLKTVKLFCNTTTEKKEKRIIKNCYNCEKIHTNKVKIKSYSIV